MARERAELASQLLRRSVRTASSDGGSLGRGLPAGTLSPPRSLLYSLQLGHVPPSAEPLKVLFCSGGGSRCFLGLRLLAWFLLLLPAERSHSLLNDKLERESRVSVGLGELLKQLLFSIVFFILLNGNREEPWLRLNSESASFRVRILCSESLPKTQPHLPLQEPNGTIESLRHISWLHHHVTAG